MKIKDLKIANQLLIGFGAMIFFVLVLSRISQIQSEELHQKTETLYNHPINVRDAINKLEIDILTLRLATSDLLLSKTQDEKQTSLKQIELAEKDAETQFLVIKAQYLGHKKDVEEAYAVYIKWKIAREENTMLAISGNALAIKESISPEGNVELARTQLLQKIQKITKFAENKTTKLYTSSLELKESLNNQLITLTAIIIFLSIVLIYLLFVTIRNPISELTKVTHRFIEGDMTVRSAISSKNEFGILAQSFNAMIENIQKSTELKNKISSMAEIMLSEHEGRTFFKSTLTGLCEYTNSQMAGVFLLSEDEKTFDHYESIGLSDAGKLSFSASGNQGELGLVISSRKIHSIKNIPLDTRYVFQAISGQMVPREIITIPILSGNKVIAIISLSSIRNYNDDANNLLNSIYDTLNARVEGVLAYRTMRHLTRKLEEQNVELEAQKNELGAQSAELTQQNSELEMQKNLLSEASKLKTNFLSNMSHELRTPLNSVIALSGVLNRRLRKKIPADEYSYLEVIERNGKQLLSLINDILDISRIESGREEVEITKFKVADLISDITEMIRPQAQQKMIELLQVASTNEVFINSDLHKCRHIMQNLIGNAVKFTEKGKVEIDVAQESENIIINVTDTGIGIAEQHHEHIFDEFRQADGSTSRRFGGTGLGLAIARKYAQLLGGNITIKSELGKGSLFSLKLPTTYNGGHKNTESLSVHMLATKQQAINKPVAGKSILLVEDSEPAIIQLKDFMEEYGYNVLVAHNANEALSVIDQTMPDAIILDLMMPDIDGFQLLETIRHAEKTAALPVLILTAKHITKEELQYLKRNNVHQLIQKGDVNRTELLNAVATMVTKSEKKVTPEIKKRQTIKGKPIVLVVEDNEDNMITVKALLEDKFTVVEATNGQEGIDRAKEHLPHLILMDLALPGMDGIEAFRKIKSDILLANIPVIALTASAMTTDREVILAHGFDAYIAKPIDDKLFFEVINKVLFGK